MDSILLIGNGFDLAHDLKTDYKSFIKHVIEENIRDEEKYSDLIVLPRNIANYEQFEKADFIHNSATNDFFKKVLLQLKRKNWCDFETFFFHKLVEIKEDPRRLNSDLEIIKHHLEDYLTTESKYAEKIPHMQSLLDSFEEIPIIITFNYTSTLNLYFNENYIRNTEIIHLHGELNNNQNEIIFGYSANDEDEQQLVDKNNSEFLRNIKAFSYPYFDNFDKLDNLLNQESDLVLRVIGHSCGMSDHQILNKLFTHDSIEKIQIIYHQSKEDFFQKTTNIRRIGGKESFSKIIPMKHSTFVPQINEKMDISEYEMETKKANFNITHFDE